MREYKATDFSDAKHLRALTLLELLLVLSILAILTTIVTRTVSGVTDQSRYEATQRTLTHIRAAVLGDSNDRQPDGQRIITGFIADLGRPPQLSLVTNTEGTFIAPSEMWQRPPSMLPYALREATSSNVTAPDEVDPEVYVPCGWRGPYLEFPPGESFLRDGWGTPLANSLPLATNTARLLRPDGTAAGLGDTLGAVVSTGPAPLGSTGDSPYDGILRVDIPATQYTAELAGQVSVRDSAGNLVSPSSSPSYTLLVKVFAPDPEGSGRIAAVTFSQPFKANPMSYVFNGTLTHGPRVLRAYLVAGALGAPGAVTRRSAVTYLLLQAGMNLKDIIVDRP